MLLRSSTIADLINVDPAEEPDPLVITPKPNTDELKDEASASVDLRLGTWFRATRARRHPVLDIYNKGTLGPTEESLTNLYYAPFGGEFVLHPRSFVLAVTLEWIRLPLNLAGMVTGKSSWGRRGLIIETAPGVHPGYTGCLTLELTNVGEIPIKLVPGTKICQLFFHKLDGASGNSDRSRYVGQRQPMLGRMELDSFAEQLAKSHD